MIKALERAGGAGCTAEWVLLMPLDSVDFKMVRGELCHVCFTTARKETKPPARSPWPLLATPPL